LKTRLEEGQTYSITMKFGKDGRSSCHAELEPQMGTYKVAGDFLTITIDGAANTSRFQLEKHTLVLYEGPGMIRKFRRMKTE
jgi:hypothetical protein